MEKNHELVEHFIGRPVWPKTKSCSAEHLRMPTGNSLFHSPINSMEAFVDFIFLLYTDTFVRHCSKAALETVGIPGVHGDRGLPVHLCQSNRTNFCNIVKHFRERGSSGNSEHYRFWWAFFDIQFSVNIFRYLENALQSDPITGRPRNKFSRLPYVDFASLIHVRGIHFYLFHIC